MHTSVFKAALTRRLILPLLIIGSFVGCADPNSVGGGIIDAPEVIFDTVFVSGFEQQSLDIFSGRLNTLPMGSYNDPLFGTIESIAYLKPIGTNLNFDNRINDDYNFELKLTWNVNSAYGDTSSSTNFNIYKVDEFWRGHSILSNDQINFDESNVLASFTYSQEDSSIIRLPESLLLEYAGFVNSFDENIDSLYNNQFFGIAIVPDQSSQSKISYPLIDEIEFLLTDPGKDSLRVRLLDYAFIVNKTNSPIINNRLVLTSIFDSYYKVSFEDAINGYEPKNLLKAELVLYEDNDQLEISLPSNNHFRPDIPLIDLKFGANTNLRYELQFTNTDFFGLKDDASNSFRFDITNHINQYFFSQPGDRILYLNLNPEIGQLNSTIIFDETVSLALRPKIVFTIVK